MKTPCSYGRQLMLIYFGLVVFLGATIAVIADETAVPATESIFNGKDLTGWKIPENNIWWKVEDGILFCQSDPGRKGSNLWTDREYGDFVVECEYRYRGEIDSGIFVRTDRQQVQMGISGSLKRDLTGSVYVAGKGYPQEAQGAVELLKPEGEWNHMRVIVKGPTYDIWLNGKHVLTFKAEDVPARGPIGLQLHGNKDMRVDFRNLRAVELSSNEKS
jgi:hypothetical protein